MERCNFPEGAIFIHELAPPYAADLGGSVENTRFSRARKARRRRELGRRIQGSSRDHQCMVRPGGGCDDGCGPASGRGSFSEPLLQLQSLLADEALERCDPALRISESDRRRIVADRAFLVFVDPDADQVPTDCGVSRGHEVSCRQQTPEQPAARTQCHDYPKTRKAGEFIDPLCPPPGAHSTCITL